MKTIIALTIILLASPFTVAETKQELIEKVIEVSNAEVIFAKATSNRLNA